MRRITIWKLADHPGGEDVAYAIQPDRKTAWLPVLAQDVQRRTLGDDSALFEQEQPRAQGDRLGGTVRDVQRSGSPRLSERREVARSGPGGCARSRAETGSSQSKSRGRGASARARPTR